MSEGRTLPVHLSALGFERNPFPQTPDADCYFRTEKIKQKFMEARHCVLAGKGFVLLTGEVGTGKSTFLRCLMDELDTEACAVSFVFNTFLQGRDLLLAINRDFGLTAGADLAEDIDRLNRFLIDLNKQGKTCVVVIDDAQNLDTASLELLRLLSNLETRQQKLLQIVLSGQPELLGLLAKPEIRQLASRIVQHIQLVPLVRAECARYIDFRVARAGSDGRLRLTEAAYHAAHRHSRGNPRRLHLIMDRCLYGVVASKRREIGKRMVDVAANEVGIAGRPRGSALLWALAGIACLGIALAAWTASHRAKPEWMLPSLSLLAPPAQSVPVAVAVAATVTPQADPVPAKIAAPPEPFEVCMESLGASAWQTMLETGLNATTQRAIERSLAEAGLALTKFLAGVDRSPRSAGKNAGICFWENPSGAWMVWRPLYPPFELTALAHGEAIRWLQIRLAEAGRYTAPIDGVVGHRTIEALSEFRSQNGLSATGGVDSWTLFLLEHGPFSQSTQSSQSS